MMLDAPAPTSTIAASGLGAAAAISSSDIVGSAWNELTWSMALEP